MGRRLGDAAFTVLGQRRHVALGNLATAFPLLGSAEIRRLCRRSFQHLGMMTLELCRLLSYPLDRTWPALIIEGREHLDGVVARYGRGLVLTAHLGNWEYLPAAVASVVDRELAIVVRPLTPAWLNTLSEVIRTKAGVEVIAKRGALRSVMSALRHGKIVGILLDQNATRSDGVFVSFFGRPASTSKGLAVLALRTATPILPIFVRRDPEGRHRVVVEPPIEPDGTPLSDEAVVTLTAECARRVEAAIRRSPDQWFWVHRRWRTRPADVRAAS